VDHLGKRLKKPGFFPRLQGGASESEAAISIQEAGLFGPSPKFGTCQNAGASKDCMTVVSTNPVVRVLPRRSEADGGDSYPFRECWFRGSRDSMAEADRNCLSPFPFQLTVFKVPS
jgi:hypothetical protein